MVAGCRHLVAVVALCAALARAQDFAPIALFAAASPCREVTLEKGLVCRIRDGAVEVVAGKRAAPMPATAATGVVHELARLPAGTVVAACERGLFVCDADHRVLDPADLRDGVVPAPIVGVAVDARGRAWLCSREQFGVVDLQVRFGRVFGANDGVPPPPFLGVSTAADGGVLLHTANGAFAYRPDAGAGPTVRAAPAAEAPLVASSAGELTLAIDVAARGGAMLRVRRRHHHLLAPLTGDRVTGLRPGRHFLEIWAFDRDLRHERVREYTVEVPVPPEFDTRLLPVLLAGFVLLLFAVAWRTGGGGSARSRFVRAFARTGVLTIVLLQAAAAVAGYGRSWPFVGFSMYTENWHEGDVLFRPRIIGLRADGTRVPLHEDDVGVMQDGYWQMLAEVVFGEARHRRELMQRVAHNRGGAPFVGFVLADGRIRLTADGPVDVAPTVLLEHRER